jgi:hypothetical protein
LEAPFGLQLIQVKVLPRAKQVLGAALKAVSLARDWPHQKIDKRLAMLLKNDTTFLDDKVWWQITPYFVTESIMVIIYRLIIFRIFAEDYVAELRSEILLIKR